MDEDHIKTRPSDSSTVPDEEENDSAADSNQEYFNDLEELEKIRLEREEQKKAALERIKRERQVKGREDEEEAPKESSKQITGQAISRPQKEFSTEKKLFRHNKMFGFSGSGAVKIERALKKAHIGTEKRRDLISALQAYNPSKSVLKKKDFTLFAQKFKSRNFSGSRFQQASKNLDIKDLRKEFSKRDLNKFRLAVTGQADSRKHQTKTSFINPGKPERNSPASRH